MLSSEQRAHSDARRLLPPQDSDHQLDVSCSCSAGFHSLNSLFEATILRHVLNSQEYTDGKRAAELGQEFGAPGFLVMTYSSSLVAHVVLTWAGRL